MLNTNDALEKEIINEYLVSMNSSNTVASEQYRKLRAAILNAAKDKPIKSLMVTSPLPGDGKSLTAVNLAISISRGIGDYVLLIDADLRRPSLHNYLNVENKAGLSEHLQYDMDIKDLISKPSISGLSLLPSGKIPFNPTELLSSRKMGKLLDEIYNRYNDRYIIFDTTPALSTSEPSIMASKVDGVIIVVQYGKTPRESIKKTIQILGHGRILGLVFNRVNTTMDTFSSSKYYY